MTDAGAHAIPPVACRRQPSASATLVLFLLVVEVLIRTDLISRYIVPPPSEIVASFWRVIVEEHVFRRFLLTATECLTAGVMITVIGVASGVLMHRYKLLQRRLRDLGRRRSPSAPVVLAYPLFMVIFGRNAWTIIMIGFVAGAAAGHPEDH